MLNFDYKNINKILYTEAEDAADEEDLSLEGLRAKYAQLLKSLSEERAKLEKQAEEQQVSAERLEKSGDTAGAEKMKKQVEKLKLLAKSKDIGNSSELLNLMLAINSEVSKQKMAAVGDGEIADLTSVFLFICQQNYMGKDQISLSKTDLKILGKIKDKTFKEISDYYKKESDIFKLLSSLSWKAENKQDDSQKEESGKFNTGIKDSKGKTLELSTNISSSHASNFLKQKIKDGGISDPDELKKFLLFSTSFGTTPFLNLLQDVKELSTSNIEKLISSLGVEAGSESTLVFKKLMLNDGKPYSINKFKQCLTVADELSKLQGSNDLKLEISEKDFKMFLTLLGLFKLEHLNTLIYQSGKLLPAGTTDFVKKLDIPERIESSKAQVEEKEFILIPEIGVIGKDKTVESYKVDKSKKCIAVALELRSLLAVNRIESDIPSDNLERLLKLLSTSLYAEKRISEILSKEGSQPYTRDIYQIIAKWSEGLANGESLVGFKFLDSFFSGSVIDIIRKSKFSIKDLFQELSKAAPNIEKDQSDDGVKAAKANLDRIRSGKLDNNPENYSITKLSEIMDLILETINLKAKEIAAETPEPLSLFGLDNKLKSRLKTDIQTGSKPDLSYDYDAITGVKKEPEESISPLVSNTDKYWEMSDEREEISEDQLENIQKIPKVSYIQFLSEYKNATKVELNDISQATALKTNLNKVFTGKALHSLLTEFDNLTDFNSALSGQHYDPISILLKIIPSVNQSKIVLVKALYSEKPLEIKDKFKDQKFGGESTVMNSELGELYYSDLESEDGNQGVEEKDSEDEAMEESLTEASDRKVIYLSILGTDTKEDAIPVYKLLTGNSSLSYFDMETSKPYTIKNLEVVELHMIEDYKIQNILSGKDDSFCIIRTFTQGAK